MRKILLAFLMLLNACAGGGSAGTGTVSVQGSLKTTNNQPIASAEVRSGEQSTVTDANGNFVLNVPSEEAEDGVIPIVVQSMGQSSSVDIETRAGTSSSATINVEIKLDPSDQLIVVNQVDVEAKIVGTCDSYFENNEIIRQANEAPQGVNCTLKVTIFGDGKRLSDVPFVIEYTGCSETRPWHLLAAGETRSAPTPGVGQLEFPFFDNDERCVYRVVAPYQLKGVPSAIVKIHTFSKQAYDSSLK